MRAEDVRTGDVVGFAHTDYVVQSTARYPRFVQITFVGTNAGAPYAYEVGQELDVLRKAARA